VGGDGARFTPPPLTTIQTRSRSAESSARLRTLCDLANYHPRARARDSRL